MLTVVAGDGRWPPLVALVALSGAARLFTGQSIVDPGYRYMEILCANTRKAVLFL